jgi:hypothetical protein
MSYTSSASRAHVKKHDLRREILVNINVRTGGASLVRIRHGLIDPPVGTITPQMPVHRRPNGSYPAQKPPIT